MATQERLISIKELHNLFQRSISRFNPEEINNKKLKSKPDIVDNVIFPIDLIECDGIDVGVEEEGDVDTEEHQGETLGNVC